MFVVQILRLSPVVQEPFHAQRRGCHRTVVRVSFLPEVVHLMHLAVGRLIKAILKDSSAVSMKLLGGARSSLRNIHEFLTRGIAKKIDKSCRVGCLKTVGGNS